MTNDLVKRLRDLNTHLDTFILDEAADRIEKLEAALQACHASLNIAFDYDESSRVFGKKFNDAVDADILARKALEGKG